METITKIKCFLCNSDTTHFSESKNKLTWYNYEGTKICSSCYYKQYRKQVKEGSFISYKQQVAERRCSRCKKQTQITITKKGYQHRKWISDGNGGYLCHNCAKKVIYSERERDYGLKRLMSANARVLWAQMSYRNHVHRGHTLNITKKDLEEMASKTDTCPICDVTLAWGYLNGKILRNSPSLDRIDNEKDIRKDNIQIICYRCNISKYDRTMKEFIDYCKHVAQKYS